MINRLAKPPRGMARPHPVSFLLAGVLLLPACGWFDHDGGGQTEAVDDSNASDVEPGDDDGDSSDGEATESTLEPVDEAEALEIIRAGAVDSGVAPDQRAGTPTAFAINRLLCRFMDKAELDELELVFPDVLEFCADTADDFWQVELFDPAGNPFSVFWRQSSFITYDFAIDDPWGDYGLIATSRNGARVEASFTIGHFTSLVLETLAVDSGSALALAGYGDQTQISLSAYSAEAGTAVAKGEDAVLYDSLMEHVTDLGPIQLDEDGLTIIPVRSEFDEFCLFPLDDTPIVPFTCFGNPPPPVFASGATQLEAELRKALDQDLRLALPLETNLDDGSVLTVATTVEPKTGRPVGTVAFVKGAKESVVNLHAFVKSDDFVSAWATICEKVRQSFVLNTDPCGATTRLPDIVFTDPLLKIDVIDVLEPIEPALPVRDFDYIMPIDPDLIRDPDLLGSLIDSGNIKSDDVIGNQTP